jgi:hypothetical protein
MIKLFGLVAFIAFGALNLTAQVSQEIRKEFDLKETDATSVLALDKNGLLTYGVENVKGAPDVFQVNLFNTNLDLVQTLTTDTQRKSSGSLQGTSFFRVATNVAKDHVYFYEQVKKNLVINILDVVGQRIETNTFKLEYIFYPSTMLELNGQLVLSGTSNKKPALLWLNPNNGNQTLTLLPGVNKRRSLESMVKDQEGNSISMMYRDGSDMKKSTLFLTVFKTDGTLTLPIELDRDMNYSIIDGNVTWLNEKDFILSGTYGTRNNYYASGMYVSKWNDGVQEFITYHSFTDFENFYAYLSPRNQERVEKKIERKKSKGKENVIKTLVTMHPAAVLDNGYAVVGEVYYPTYRTETRTTYVNGRPTYTTVQVFDGYQYSHAVVMGVGFSGNLEYDHCFPMMLSYKPYAPQKNLRLVQDGETLKMILFDRNTFTATTVRGSFIETTESAKLTTDVQGDSRITTYGSSSQYWFDNFYITYCFQKIINKNNDDVDRKRNVFVMTKVSYQ